MVSIQPAADQVTRSASRWRIWFGRFEDWLERIADRFNPILVKECRQALKSRQFTITFTLVLALCWLWSIYGIAMVGPSVHFSAGTAGLRMFYGYFCILAFPLLVVVPFGAFRSLADERDDNTFDLLAITALGPRQIVAGKLGTAVVQMLVYLSAITPCLTFTYLLRGIEAPTILITIVYMFLGSLALSMVGLLAATLAHERHWQTLWSAAVVLGLVVVFLFVVGNMWEFFNRERIPFESPIFWRVNVGISLAYLSYFALCFLAAVARLTFPSENRSTALRIVMLVQQLLLVFGLVWAVFLQRGFAGDARYANMPADLDRIAFEIMAPIVLLLAVHWYLLGLFVMGELPRLSNRAKRRLPQSFLGRAFFTWFNPGPASGYVFVVSNLFSVLALWLALMAFGQWNSARVASDVRLFVYLDLLAFGYVTFYLGLGRLVLAQLRRVAPVGMFLGVLIQVLLLMIGCVAPILIEEVSGGRHWDYNFWYVYHPFATFGAAFKLMEIDIVVVIVLGSALAVLLANLPGVAAELRQVRVEAPRRVIEEEELLHPKPVIAPVNPFD